MIKTAFKLISVDMMMWWHDDMMTVWHVDMMTWWHDDAMTWWRDDMMTWWHDDMMTWWHDDMTTWWQDNMIKKWHHDMMTWWHDDRIYIINLLFSDYAEHCLSILPDLCTRHLKHEDPALVQHLIKEIFSFNTF